MIFFPYVRFSVCIDNYHHKLRLLGAGLTLDMAKVNGLRACRFCKLLGDHRVLWAQAGAHRGPLGTDATLKAVSPETTGIPSD